jgi:hypothetical protein
MSQAQQPEALVLATRLREGHSSLRRDLVPAAVELERLHAHITELDATNLRELTAYRTTVDNQAAEIEALRARCAELEVGWLPISEAPKSGRTLMLGFFNASGKWRTTRGQWFSQEQIEDTWENGDDCEEGWYETPVVGEVCYPVAPTHSPSRARPPGSACRHPVSISACCADTGRARRVG